jgi:hypothetical protein
MHPPSGRAEDKCRQHQDEEKEDPGHRRGVSHPKKLKSVPVQIEGVDEC